MASHPSRAAIKQSTTSVKAAARSQGIHKPSPSVPPRRSLRLLAAQAISQSPQIAGIIEPQLENTSRKRKYDSLSQGTPVLPTKKQRLDPIEHWRRQGKWPQELFEPDSMPPSMRDASDDVLARSISRKRSIGGTTTSSRDLNREEKAAPYQDIRYEENLQKWGDVYMDDEDKCGPSQKALDTIEELLKKKVEFPQNTKFDDKLYDRIIKDCHGMNEAWVIRDIGLLVCPSARDLLLTGAIQTKYLRESVDEAWKLSRPITSTRPQPDFSVGYGRDAFTEEQLEKIRAVLGNGQDQSSLVRATWYMYFPFLGCEAKKGDGGLDVADRQNAHSMGMAVRGVVKLFRLVGRAKELDRQILAFSISYNEGQVRIYGYYPRVQDKTNYYRRRIAFVTLIGANSQERWKAYKFVSNIYQHWAPKHLKNLQLVLTEIDTIVAAPTVKTGLSQVFSNSSISSEMPSAEDLQTEPTTPIEAAIPPATRMIKSSPYGRDDTSTTSKRRASVRSSQSKK